MLSLSQKINVLDAGKLDISKLGIVVWEVIVLVPNIIKSLRGKLHYIRKDGKHIEGVGFDIM